MRKEQKGNPAACKRKLQHFLEKTRVTFHPASHEGQNKHNLNTTVMKKHIVIIAGLVMFSLSLTAQNQRETNARVTESFNKNFPGARNVTWTPLKGQVRKAQFGYQGNSCIAFFGANAELISSGKRIKDISTLPQLAAQALGRQKTRLEKKFGILNRLHTFEFVSGNTTRWYSTLANQKALIVVSADATGHSVVESRKINKSAPEMPTPVPPKDVIAKQ